MHASEGIYPGFDTHGRCHQKSETGVSVASQKKTAVLQNVLEKKKIKALNIAWVLLYKYLKENLEENSMK